MALASDIRNYLRTLTELSLSGPANRDEDNGFPNLVNRFRILDRDFGHFRWKNTGCYRVDFSTVSFCFDWIVGHLPLTGMLFNANSVAIILVRCAAAALLLLYANRELSQRHFTVVVGVGGLRAPGQAS